MEQVTLKLTELRPPEKNIRLHTEKQIQEFVKSIKMFGQIRPIVVDEDNTVLCGNGLFEAMKRAGEKKALAYRFTGLTENQKKKLMISDNKIFSLGVDNLDTLNEFISSLGNDLSIPGFDEDILRQMVADADEVTERLSQYGTLTQEEREQIRNSPQRSSIEPNTEDYGSAESENGTDRTMDGPGSTPAETGRYVICPKCGEQIWL